MASSPLPKKTIAQIQELVATYSARREDFVHLAKRVEAELVENAKLRPLIHSTKRREKACLRFQLRRGSLAFRFVKTGLPSRSSERIG